MSNNKLPCVVVDDKRAKKKYSRLEKKAYWVGRVFAELNNGNSKIAESYNNGVNSVKKKK